MQVWGGMELLFQAVVIYGTVEIRTFLTKVYMIVAVLHAKCSGSDMLTQPKGFIHK